MVVHLFPYHHRTWPAFRKYIHMALTLGITGRTLWLGANFYPLPEDKRTPVAEMANITVESLPFVRSGKLPHLNF